MIKKYRKGYRGEIELVHILSEKGWLVIRSPRSGRISLPSPDIIALKKGRVVVFEVKMRREAFVMDQGQINQLARWKKEGADAYVAWKIPRIGWRFLKISDVIQNKGRIGKGFCLSKGLKLEEVI